VTTQGLGELDVDLRAKIAAEARAKDRYERLINFRDQGGNKSTPSRFLMNAKYTYGGISVLATAMGQDGHFRSAHPPTHGLVDQYVIFHGTGAEAQPDVRGPWKRTAKRIKLLNAPGVQFSAPPEEGSGSANFPLNGGPRS